MRFNANVSAAARDLTVYLNGEKEPNTIEVYIPGNVLEGEGYVIRAVTGDDGKVVPSYGIKPLRPGFYDSNGAMCERKCGHIRIEIAECFSEFGEP